jgi:hypothetical protein
MSLDPPQQKSELEVANEIVSAVMNNANGDAIMAAVNQYQKELGGVPPSFCVGAATLVALSIMRTDNPLLMRKACFLMIDRLLADMADAAMAERQQAEQEARDATFMADSPGLDHVPSEKEPEA